MAGDGGRGPVSTGGASQAHRHPGFVLGYLLEGEIRFGVDGGEQTIYRANQVFYEPPGVRSTPCRPRPVP